MIQPIQQVLEFEASFLLLRSSPIFFKEPAGFASPAIVQGLQSHELNQFGTNEGK